MKTNEEERQEKNGEQGTMEVLTELGDHSIQQVLSEIETGDLVVALRGVSPGVRDVVMRNMSRQAAVLVREEDAFIGPAKEETVAKAQEGVVAVVKRLDAAGALGRLAEGGGDPGDKDASLQPLRDMVRHKGVGERMSWELAEVMVCLGGIARRCGILALEKELQLLDDAFLAHGVMLAVDGTDPALIRELLARKKRSLLEELERRLDLEITGVLSLQQGDNPRIIEQKCQAHFATPQR